MDVHSAVVLAAGEGRGLRPLTANRPKPLLPAGDRPILEHVLDALVAAGADDLHLVVGYERERVQSHVGPTYRDRPVTYHVQEPRLGSGHALLQARDAVDEPVLVVNGDELLTADAVSAVAGAHDPDDAATLAVAESERAPEYGAVRLAGDRVVDLVERPDSGEYRLLNRGVYALSRVVLDELDGGAPGEDALSLPEAVARLVDGDNGDGHGDAAVGAVVTAAPWTSATYPWDLLSVAEDVLAAGRVETPARADGVHVAASATVHDRATLRPPVVVRGDATVGPGATVGSATAIGRNATVGASAVVERSVVDDDTRVGPGAVVREAVTGQAADVGAGATIPGGPASVRVGDRVHEDCDLGCVVADRSRLGGGVTVAPGALVGPRATAAAGAHVAGRLPADAEVRR